MFYILLNHNMTAQSLVVTLVSGSRDDICALLYDRGPLPPQAHLLLGIHR